MKIQGPIEVEIKVKVTNGQGINGVATITLGQGKYATEDEMRAAVAEFEQKSMPEGFRLMTKHEWWNSVVPPSYEEDDNGERIPVHYAVPGGDDYDE